MAKVVQECYLEYRQGTSDKVYNIRLIQDHTGEYRVKFEYGRRFNSLTGGSKVGPVSYAVAEAAYDKLYHEKTAKGYVHQRTGSEYTNFPAFEKTPQPEPVPDNPSRKDSFLYSPQTGNPPEAAKATASEVDKLINDPNWLLQEKPAGVRLILEVSDGTVRGHSKQGTQVTLPLDLINRLADLPDCVLDGMLDRDQFTAWDILSTKTTIWRSFTLIERLAELDTLLFVFGHIISGVPAIGDPQAKREAYAKFKAAGKPVVFKHAGSAYIMEQSIAEPVSPTWMEAE